MRRRVLLGGVALGALFGGGAANLTSTAGKVLSSGPGATLGAGLIGVLPYLPNPTSIAGITSWSYAGNAAPAAVASLPDLTGNGHVVAVNQSGAAITNMVSLGGVIQDRLVGLLGGLRLEYDVTGTAGGVAADVYPYYDPSGSFSVSGVSFASAVASTVYVVFSRGNLAQTFSGGFAYTSGTIPVVSAGGATLVGITNTGADGTTAVLDTLTLFPGTAQAITISSTATQRFTRSLTLVNNGSTTDVYLDDTKVVTAAANAMIASGVLKLGSNFDLHEIATWNVALGAPAILLLLTNGGSMSKRWARGARKAYTAMFVGQSNANHFLGGDSFATPLGVQTFAKALRWTLGAICAMPITGWGYVGTGAIRDGNPFYDIVTPSNPYPWFAYNAGQPPSAWALASASAAGPMVNFNPWSGNSRLNGTQPVAMWFWTETDSGQDTYAQQVNFQAARIRAYGQMRTGFGLTAAQFPMYEIAPLPFNVTQTPGNGQGYFQRQSFDAIVATGATNNVQYSIANTSDSLPSGATLNANGTFTGGDTAHRDPTDLVRFGYLMGLQVGASLITQGLGELLVSVPAGVSKANGPKVTSATVSAANTVTVTVQHDGGSALVVGNPAGGSQASNGIGWQIMSGGSLASPGTIFNASACSVVDATHLTLTFPSLGSPTVGTCLLFYGGYGMVDIGPGSAVYDNYASVTPPAGWNPSRLASGAVLNRPLQQVNAMVV